MKQFGTVLTFKPGTSVVDVKAALDTLKPILAKDWVNYPDATPTEYVIHQFDGAHGGPVWYIP
jgi:hypothetical protein